MPNTEAFVTQLMIRAAYLLGGVALLAVGWVSRGLVAWFEELGNCIVRLICFPFVTIYEESTKALENRCQRDGPFRNLSKNHPALGTPRSICSALAALVLVGVCFLQAGQNGELTAYVEKMFFATPFGAVVDMLLNKVKLTPALLVSTSCSTLISWLLFTGGGTETSFDKSLLGKIVAFFYHVIFLAAGCIIGMWLAGCWQPLTDWVTALYLNVRDAYTAIKASDGGIVKLLLSGVPLLLLLYLWLIALSLAAREYIATLGHGILTAALMFGILLLAGSFLPQSVQDSAVGNIIGYVFIGLAIIFDECIRSDPEFLDLDNH